MNEERFAVITRYVGLWHVDFRRQLVAGEDVEPDVTDRHKCYHHYVDAADAVQRWIARRVLPYDLQEAL